MKLMVIGLLLQALAAPDPSQMEKAPSLPLAPVSLSLRLPEGWTLGAPSAVAFDRQGHLVIFNRGEHPLIEVDESGGLIRAFGQEEYTRPHGLRIDPDGDVWTTDVARHTVVKLNTAGRVLLRLGVPNEPGDWNEAAGSRRLNQPTDVGFAPNGDIFVTQGHGTGDPRVLRFDRMGRFLRSWGGKGTEPGRFDIAHSIVVDARGLVYVADRQNRRVQVFDMNGTLMHVWTFAGLPCGLFLNPNGAMYMVTGFAGQILKLDAAGKAVAAIGQPGKGLGEFGEAHYMAMSPGGDVYVADTVNAVLHRFAKR